MVHFSHIRQGRQRGFSMMEIMVGVAIALIGIVVIFQVLEVWEARKRTTSSGSDAQISGTIAMFNMERDIKLAGYGFGTGFNTPSFMGSSVCAFDSQRAAGAQYFSFGLNPIQIIDNGGAPDRIVVLYGASQLFTADQPFTATNATSMTTNFNASFQKGELVLVCGATPTLTPSCAVALPLLAPPPLCALVEVTNNTLATTLNHDTGAYINYYGDVVTARYNSATGTGASFTSGSLYNLGAAQAAPGWPSAPASARVPQLNTWRINNNNTLAWSDGLHSNTTWNEVADGIVNLQAQYGYDNDNNNQIECPNGAGLCEWRDTLQSPPLTAPMVWTRVRAVRVALLARSQQYEKTGVYSPAGCVGAGCAPRAPEWAGGFFTMTNADGSADSNPGDTNDWRHYRYRVYEKIIPLRNMIWPASPSS